MSKKKNTQPETTETETTTPAPAGTSLNARMKSAFMALFAVLEDIAPALDQDLYDRVAGLGEEMASKRLRGIPAEDRLAMVEAQIQDIYESAQGDFGVLTEKQDELQALFVKKQNLERRITTDQNKAAAE